MRYDLQSSKQTPLVDQPSNEYLAALSPDDKWLAYASDATGRFEVYVQAIEPGTGRWQISTEGGGQPVWRRDGKELYYRTALGRVMAVEITADTAFRSSTPRELFRADFIDVGLSTVEFAPLPDGQRFVVNALKERRTPQLMLMTRWRAAAPGSTAPRGAR